MAQGPNPILEPVFSLRFVQEALKIKATGAATGFEYITSDSRSVKPGALFVALKGEKFDGHDFIASAIEKGADGVICNANRELAGLPSQHSAAIFRVKNSLEAYRKLAFAWRQRFAFPFLAVAGSVGKTTTKELIAAILRGRYKRILKTKASQNGFIGIPMTLLELRRDDEAAVIEIGIDALGAMKQHLEIVQPDLSILTRLGPEHLETLKNMKNVLKEETLAIRWTLSKGGLAVCTLDDDILNATLHAKTLVGKTRSKLNVVSLDGKNHPAGSKPLKAEYDPINHSLKVLWDKREEVFLSPLPGKHNAENLLIAISAAKALDFEPNEIRKGLLTFEGEGGRTQIYEIEEKDIIILADYYNANPTSVLAAFELMGQLTQERKGKRWVCLADMLELGDKKESFHRELAPLVSKLNFDQVLLLGPLMKHLFDELRHSSFRGKFQHFESHKALVKALEEGLGDGDTILIKGSRGMAMEKVLEALQDLA